MTWRTDPPPLANPRGAPAPRFGIAVAMAAAALLLTTLTTTAAAAPPPRQRRAWPSAATPSRY
nr:hypothetical protein [Burkholderia gladioli]